jgi:hypothetical protein
LLSSLSSPSLLCFVELASIMTESSHYCHHTCWLMYGIDLHLLPRAYEACVDVMFTGHYHTCCWKSLKRLVTFAVVQTTLSLSQSRVSSFPICWYAVRTSILITLLSVHLSILFRLT